MKKNSTRSLFIMKRCPLPRKKNRLHLDVRLNAIHEIKARVNKEMTAAQSTVPGNCHTDQTRLLNFFLLR